MTGVQIFLLLYKNVIGWHWLNMFHLIAKLLIQTVSGALEFSNRKNSEKFTVANYLKSILKRGRIAIISEFKNCFLKGLSHKN